MEKLSSSVFILGSCKQESAGREQLSFKCTQQIHTGTTACRKLTFWLCPQLFAASYFQQLPVKKQARNATGEAATRYFTALAFASNSGLAEWQQVSQNTASAVHGQTSAWQTLALKTSNCSGSKGIQDAFKRGAVNECPSTTSEFYWQ